MSTLVLVDHDNQRLHPTSYNMLSAALLFNEPVDFLVIGHQCQAVADEASKISGVSKVLCADSPAFSHLLAEPVARLIVSQAASYHQILAASSTSGKNILPRVAAILDVAQVSDVIEVIDASTFKHPIYAGNAIETVQVLDSKKILTIRTTAFEAKKIGQSPCTIMFIDMHGVDERVAWVNETRTISARPQLGASNIVVSGGRGLQSAEKFKLVEELADALGAAVGASRAAVDAGFVPNDYQVGQTGKVVAPDLYIALGISGAIQHLAGMKDSKVIVAINKDEDAPIFKIATYGLVGDVFELVPQLIEQLKKR